jgi:sugar phosphate isomerase/epimerase
MTMFPSACTWSYTTPVADALRQLKETAFHFVDVRPSFLSDGSAMKALKDLGLKISCVAIDRDLPAGASLEGETAVVRRAVDLIRQSLDRSAEAGAKYAYVRPCKSAKNLKPFGAAVAELAAHAVAKGVRLSVEHTPGSALPTARETLRWLDQLSTEVGILLDTGHLVLSKECPWETVTAAGPRIGYVQLNDNDGRCDRHWPLTDGKLTEDDLRKTIQALAAAGYSGTLGLELNPDFASLIGGFSKNRNLTLRLQATAEVKSFKEPEKRRK